MGTTGSGSERGGGLADDRALLGRTSTAERVADILRTRIAEGFFPPGTRLSEDSIGGALGVSRNTLREAFRLLTHERLLVHELNRGVFVRVLAVGDVVDIYRTRRLVECAVVHGLGEPPYALDGLIRAVGEGERDAREGDWKGVSTANIHFHRELVALAGSDRTDELMRGVLAELRLVFHMVDDPRALHEPYLIRNREILDALRAGERTRAERLLVEYLDDSRERLVQVYAHLVEDGPTAEAD
ncbi:GntR family transcriptional regulator [Streptomyces sp. WAC05374]|uniref:GntR family transcriptional regulator n=1 Tax=Streptomyces sp. WAC05374 TaxID=2487420 RepID=UPI000F85F3CC|nr:GntR family transcriptional regulator [Streptomyces sp. WAC05374]RST09406.1 GntR family transcriptional regulator [Streptomyces sp. WAC05374]TDF43415.1 GntR family transcriptional regulator [Streptomyces sp. WAC05374]TDF51686.1 GntR family transcriptional regulator [Streptomyces sp. WAC05374]TDF53161.1 GntR family transcriptional regulator [Streptomyces sp. WAC05374]